MKQYDYLLGFVSPNKYSLKITINIKWLENQSNPKQDKYESLTLVYSREIDTMVPLARVSLKTPSKVQGSWSDNDVEMPEVVVEPSRGVDNGLGPNIQGFPQHYHRGGHWHQW